MGKYTVLPSMLMPRRGAHAMMEANPTLTLRPRAQCCLAAHSISVCVCCVCNVGEDK